MRFKGKHRVTKQDLKEDKFQVFVEKVTAAYYRDRQRFWVVAGVVVVVIVGAIVMLQNRGKGDNSEAQLRFTEALGIYSQNQLQEAEEAFKSVASRFSRDYVGVKAHYYLGQIYFESQQYEEAKREFEQFLAKSRDNPVLSPAALAGIADCESELGNPLKAAERYESVYRRYPKSPLALEAAMAAGRSFVSGGALDRAEKLYQELLKKEPPGEQSENLKVELSYLKTLREKF
ncbi:MAG: tetratricopeptide repeat protein [candidate division WOR-3 bacterium]